MGFYSPILYPVPLYRGGLGADVSAYNGIVYIANGAAGQVIPGLGVNFDPNTGILTGRLRVQRNGSTVGDRPILNFIEGSGVQINAQEDIPNNRVNVEISCDCGNQVQLENAQLIRPLHVPSPVPDGVTTAFTLPQVPDANSADVYLNGYHQISPADYSIAGNILTFTSPPVGPPDADSILIDYWTGSPSQSTQRIMDETPGGAVDGVNTTFTVANNIYLNTERLFLGPLLQIQGVDYTIGPANQINFTVAPIVGDDLSIDYWAVGALAPLNTVWRDAYTGAIDGVNDTFTLTLTPEAGTVHVYRNGQLDTPGLDYDVVANTVVFQAGYIPVTGDTVEIFYDTPLAPSAFVTADRVMYEVPPEVVNGINNTFTFLFPAVPGLVEFYDEGSQLLYGVEFTVVGQTITTTFPPAAGRRVWINYWRS